MNEKKVRCRQCRKTIGILRGEVLELKCPHCDALNQWDSQGKRVRLAGVVRKKR